MSDAAPLREPLSTVDEVRSVVLDLLRARPGTLRMCDALVKVAAEMAEAVAGSASTAAWLERTAAEVRRKRAAR